MQPHASMQPAADGSRQRGRDFPSGPIRAGAADVLLEFLAPPIGSMTAQYPIGSRVRQAGP